MEKLTRLQYLLVVELQNLYCSEEQMQKLLPKLSKKAAHASLKNFLKHQVTLLEDHKERLEEIIRSVTKEKIEIKSCNGVQGLIDETMSSIKQKIDNEAKDILIITGLQKIESYKICCYNNARVYASLLTLRKEKLFQKILEEEHDERDLLNQLLAAVLTKAEDKIRTEEITGKNVSSGQSNVNEEHENIEDNTSHSVDSTENIQSPGGRAGTSHRSYSRGESRGH